MISTSKHALKGYASIKICSKSPRRHNSKHRSSTSHVSNYLQQAAAINQPKTGGKVVKRIKTRISTAKSRINISACVSQNKSFTTKDVNYNLPKLKSKAIQHKDSKFGTLLLKNCEDPVFTKTFAKSQKHQQKFLKEQGLPQKLREKGSFQHQTSNKSQKSGKRLGKMRPSRIFKRTIKARRQKLNINCKNLNLSRDCRNIQMGSKENSCKSNGITYKSRRNISTKPAVMNADLDLELG